MLLSTEVLKYDRVLFTSSLNHSWNHSFSRREKAAARCGNAEPCLNPSQKHLHLASWHLNSPQLWCNCQELHSLSRERQRKIASFCQGKQLCHCQKIHMRCFHAVCDLQPLFSNLGLHCTEEVNHQKESLRNYSLWTGPSSSADGPKCFQQGSRKH